MCCNCTVNVFFLLLRSKWCACIFRVWSLSCLSNLLSFPCLVPFLSWSCLYHLSVLSLAHFGSMCVPIPVLSMYGSYGPCFFPSFICLVHDLLLGQSEIQTWWSLTLLYSIFNIHSMKSNEQQNAPTM